MDVFIWLAATEGSLPSIADRSKRRAAIVCCAAWLAAAIVAVGCSASTAPSTPDPFDGPFIGTWTGTIKSSVIGAGTANVVFDSGLKFPDLVQVTGHWAFAFADSRFNASGTVTGTQVRNDSSFVLLFSASTVPCPAERDGTAQRGRTASLTLGSNRMQGSYMDNGCPGGSLDLARK